MKKFKIKKMNNQEKGKIFVRAMAFILALMMFLSVGISLVFSLTN